MKGITRLIWLMLLVVGSHVMGAESRNLQRKTKEPTPEPTFVPTEAPKTTSVDPENDAFNFADDSSSSGGLSYGGGIALGILMPILLVGAIAVGRKLYRDGAPEIMVMDVTWPSITSLTPSITALKAAATGKSSEEEQLDDNVYIAQHEHLPEESNELKFEVGDKIRIIERDPHGWWKGENLRTGEEGVFPCNYLKGKKKKKKKNNNKK